MVRSRTYVIDRGLQTSTNHLDQWVGGERSRIAFVRLDKTLRVVSEFKMVDPLILVPGGHVSRIEKIATPV